jgi:hypothetical protein
MTDRKKNAEQRPKTVFVAAKRLGRRCAFNRIYG